MSVSVSILESGSTYTTSPSSISSLAATAFQFTNNTSGGVTLYFQVGGNAAGLQLQVNLAAGGTYTTPTLNPGSVSFAIVALNGANPYSHIIHVGSTVP